MEYKKYDAQEVIDQIAACASAMAFQAGVGAMETAGAIVGYLAKNPKDLEPFMVGGVMELPMEFFVEHDLTWHSHGGKIIDPATYRRGRRIAALKRGKAA